MQINISIARTEDIADFMTIESILVANDIIETEINPVKFLQYKILIYSSTVITVNITNDTYRHLGHNKIIGKQTNTEIGNK